MVDFKNEVAGIVAIGGFVSLVFALTGVAWLLDVALGEGSVVVTSINADGGQVASDVANATAGSSPLLGGVLTAVGIAGLLCVWAAVASGYFEPSPEPVTESETESEPEQDAEPA